MTKRLYNILSDGLLDSYDITHMGQNYREAPVYILDGGKLTGILDEGVNYQIIDNFRLLTNRYKNYLFVFFYLILTLN